MNVSEDEEEEDDEEEEEGGDERPLIEDEHFEDVFPAHAKVSELRAWSYSNFCVQWKKHFSHVRFFHRVWGVCDFCRKRQVLAPRHRVNADSDEMSDSDEEEMDESEEEISERAARMAVDSALELSDDPSVEEVNNAMERVSQVIEEQVHHREVRDQEWMDHLDQAWESRKTYKRAIISMISEGRMRVEDHIPHITFDFAASLPLPNELERATAFDFADVRRVRCFGVLDDGKKHQHNFLFWEYISTGNSNTTISLLDKYVPISSFLLFPNSFCCSPGILQRMSRRRGLS